MTGTSFMGRLCRRVLIALSLCLGSWALPANAVCVVDGDTLCLNGGRFQVEVDWTDFRGRQGVGTALPQTDDTGIFWFFNQENLELAVKVLDGRVVNGNYWVFYGALTNVAFDLTVTDTETGSVKVYHNPSRVFASQGDTRAFPATGAATSSVGAPDLFGVPVALTPPPGVKSLEQSFFIRCQPATDVLCLEQIYEIRVRWKDFQGREGVGQQVKLTPNTGYFWFFDEENLEVMVKVLDARQVNGHYWVFFGSLTNVEFTLTVKDTFNGTVRTYTNPSRQFASLGDTSAF